MNGSFDCMPKQIHVKNWHVFQFKSEREGFKTMMSTHWNWFAKVKNMLCYEVPEMYNEGLQKQGVLLESVLIAGNNGGDGDSTSI